METNIQTATTYVNNLLLARGLLRGGKAIDFTNLLTSQREGKEDAYGTVVQVINVVHDLILRRDRDQETHASLSATLTSLRSSQSSATSTITRLEERNAELKRQREISDAAARAAQHAAHAAESSARILREELSRAKTTLNQVRTQCANDVRKRDVEMKRLKKHLTDTQRGTNTNGVTNARSVGASCTVSAGLRNNGLSGLGSASGATIVFGGSNTRGEPEAPPSLEDAEYSLQQETTEFLTQLSQSMSDENDALITMVRSTLSTLRELMNLPGGPTAKVNPTHSDEFVIVEPTSYEILANDLQFVLSRLQVLLTRDDFVPISEVFARDEEILRLRDGWEKMGARWAEAVDMMKAWQDRMVKGGDTVNLDELKAGLNLGEGLRLADTKRAKDEAAGHNDVVDDPNSEDEAKPAVDENVVFADVQGLSSSPAASPPVSTALREASNNLISPTTLAARVRKVRLQTSQSAADQQENIASLGSPVSRSTSSSFPNNDGTLGVDPAKHNVQKVTSTKLSEEKRRPVSKSTLSRPKPQGPARSNLPTTATTRTRPTQNIRSKTAPVPTSTQASPRPDFHTHLNNLLTTSSPTSSPEAKPRAKEAGDRSIAAKARANAPSTNAKTATLTSRPTRPTHVRSASSSTSVEVATSHISSPSRGASARLREREQKRSQIARTREVADVDADVDVSHGMDGMDGLRGVDVETAEEDIVEIENEVDQDQEEDQNQPPLSVRDKLRHAENEARRVSGFALSSSSPPPESKEPQQVDVEIPETKAKNTVTTSKSLAPTKSSQSKISQPRSHSMAFATSQRSRRRKRKSTLSPEELEELMGLRSPVSNGNMNVDVGVGA